MGETSIEWTDATWNPVTGCTKVSAGCKNCYAERIFPRPYGGTCRCGHKEESHDHNDLSIGQGVPATCFHQGCNCARFKQRKFTDVLTHPDRLEQPLHWKKPRRVFVNSMSDLFHEDVPFEFIDKVFAVMALTPQHTYQILTKRPERMREYWQSVRVRMDAILIEAVHVSGQKYSIEEFIHKASNPLPNVWLGVSVEDQKTADARIPLLLQTPAAIRFVSYEPALGPIDFERGGFALHRPVTSPSGKHYPGLDWIIVGGESGPGARSFNLQWARDVVQQCKAAGVACFVKQFGSVPVIPLKEWETQGKSTGKWRILNARNDRKVSVDMVPILCSDRKGGDMTEWPADLRVREFPK